jgi:Ca2+-dependent lipid-binding protein
VSLCILNYAGTSDLYVKVKLGEKSLYKSTVITANLNPIWNETFTLPIDDLNEQLVFKVCLITISTPHIPSVTAQ